MAGAAGAGGEATQGIRGHMAAGHHGNTGIGGHGRRRGFTVHDGNKLAAHLAAAQAPQREPCLASSGEEHDHRNTPDRLRVALERQVPRAPAGTLPGPSCGFLASRKREGTNKPMPAGATRATTLTRIVTVGGAADVPDIPEVVSEQSGAGGRDGMPGTLLSESRCRMALSAIRASPKRRDAWLAEAPAVTDASVCRRSGMIARSIAGTGRAGRLGRTPHGRASRLWRSVPGAAGQRLGGMPARPVSGASSEWGRQDR